MTHKQLLHTLEHLEELRDWAVSEGIIGVADEATQLVRWVRWLSIVARQEEAGV